MSYSILIVDDTAILAEAIADMLRMEDLRVTLSSNGLEALAVLEHQRHDLIISDLRMPVMGGIEFIKRVRKNDSQHRTPIIVLSAQAEEASKRECIQAGANLFLTKPFDEQELLSSIKKFLDERQS
ncbi:MAG: response regulator [Cyclobacteriaceae bacterium]|nr:response regulator [Cyclobacteriaceae bacterium]